MDIDVQDPFGMLSDALGVLSKFSQDSLPIRELNKLSSAYKATIEHSPSFFSLPMVNMVFEFLIGDSAKLFLNIYCAAAARGLLIDEQNFSEHTNFSGAVVEFSDGYGGLGLQD